MDLGHWEFDYEFDINDWYGFVYRIIEIPTGKEYIGKKQFFSRTRKTVKGRVNKKIVKKESDWKTYSSSSEHLIKAINETGKHNFKFLIESLHKTKGSLHYAEVRAQILEDVLRTKLSDNITPKYYNRQVSAVKFIPPEENDDETLMKTKVNTINRFRINPEWRNTLTEDKIKLLKDKHFTNKNTLI